MIELRRQAVGIQALLAVIEWGDAGRISMALGVPHQTVLNRLSYLYHLLGVKSRVQATLLLWPLLQDVAVVRNRQGRVLGDTR